MNSNEDYLDKLLAGALGNAGTNGNGAGNENSSFSDSDYQSDIGDNTYIDEEGPDDYFESGQPETAEDSVVAADNPYKNMSQAELASFLNSIAGTDIIRPQAPVEPKHDQIAEAVIPEDTASEDMVSEDINLEVAEVTEDNDILSDDIVMDTDSNDNKYDDNEVIAEAVNDSVTDSIVEDISTEDGLDSGYEEESLDDLAFVSQIVDEAMATITDEPDEPITNDSIPVVSDDFILENDIPVVSDDIMSEDNISAVSDDIMAENDIPVVSDDIMAENDIPVVSDDIMAEDNISVVSDDIMAENDIPVVSDDIMAENDIPVVSDDIMAEDNIPVVEDELIDSDIPVETPEISDDPNKMMSPDDIAALIAGMGGDEAVENTEEVSEIVPEEIPEEIAEEISEEASEIATETPEISDDPNKMMSPDDIAALIAGMGGDEAVENTEEVSETLSEEIPEEIAEEISEEASEIASETPEISDDPNKMMSPDDIAALIAGMDGGSELDNIAESLAEDVPDEIIEDSSNTIDQNAGELSLEDIDRESDELMSLLMDDEAAGNETGMSDESSQGEAQEDGLFDFGEDDILKRLEEAENLGNEEAKSESLAAGSDLENADVTELLDMVSADENISEIKDVLNKSDNSVLVKADGVSEEAPKEGTADTKEEKKKGGIKDFFGKLFKKKDKKSSDENEANNADVNAESSSESSEAAKTEESKSEESNSDELSEVSKEDVNILSAEDLFGSIEANGEPMTEEEMARDSAEAASIDGALGEDKAESQETDKDKKKEKKKGFFAKIIEALTEEVEEEVPVSEDSQLNLSDENKQVLAALDGEPEEDGKKKKKKEKKPKEKKPKKEKVKKPKKEKLKAPKEENAKKIPKKHISAVVMLAASILVAMLVITSLVPKGMVMSEGRNEFYAGNYKEAFLCMYGKDLNDSDKLLYNKARTIVILDRKYESYQNYKKMGMERDALNALFDGLVKYNKLEKRANELGVINEVDTTKTMILSALYNDYGISESEAMEILDYSDLDYTLKLDSVISGEEFIKTKDRLDREYNLTSPEENVSEDSEEIILEDLLPEEENYLNNRNIDPGDMNLNNNDETNYEFNDDNNQNNSNELNYNNQDNNVNIQIESSHF